MLPSLIYNWMVNIMDTPEYQITDNYQKCQDDPISIGAACVAELAPNVFVLLVEIEVEVPGEDIEEVLIIRLTPAQAAGLIRSSKSYLRIFIWPKCIFSI